MTITKIIFLHNAYIRDYIDKLCMYVCTYVLSLLCDAHQLKAKNATANIPARTESDNSHAEPYKATMYNTCRANTMSM